MTWRGRSRPGGSRPQGRAGQILRRAHRRLRSADPAQSAVSAHELLQARQTLSFFVEHEAGQAAAEVGFGWVSDEVAPDRYDVLLAAFERCRASGEPLTVSSLFCDSTVYTDPKTNMAFRFWHDVSHVRLGLSFDLVDELELALWHLSELTARGFGPESVVWNLLHADIVGQIYVMAMVHRFPVEQGSFVIDCLQRGFNSGVLTECRLTSIEASLESDGQAAHAVKSELSGL